MVSPNCIADDLGRETIAGVTRAIAFHGTSVSGLVANLTMPLRVMVDSCERAAGPGVERRLRAARFPGAQV
jgi:hypothetical protein